VILAFDATGVLDGVLAKQVTFATHGTQSHRKS
jgi:hypothetical protein